MDISEIQRRIDEFYLPYHQEIQDAIEEKLNCFNKVYLLDLRSFGKNVVEDIVLGNDNHKTTTNSFFELISKLLKDEGFKISDNTSYSGGYITKHYGRDTGICNALQI